MNNSPQANKKEVLEGYSIQIFGTWMKKNFVLTYQMYYMIHFNKDRKNYIEDKSIENKILKEKITTECLKTIGGITLYKVFT